MRWRSPGRCGVGAPIFTHCSTNPTFSGGIAFFGGIWNLLSVHLIARISRLFSGDPGTIAAPVAAFEEPVPRVQRKPALDPFSAPAL